MMVVLPRLLFPLGFICTLATSGAASPAPPPVVCGSDVVTVGDAWQKILRARQETQALLDAGNLKDLPPKLGFILLHLRFMQQNAIMVFGREKNFMDRAIVASLTLQGLTASVAGEKDVDATRKHWAELEQVLQFTAKQFPEEALMSAEQFAHLLPPQEPVLHIQMESLPEMPVGKTVRLKFQMVRQKDLSPVGKDDIITMHGAPLHALICDASLTDYHHEHPVPTDKPGEWELTFTPRSDQYYRLWINAVPKETGREEFPVNSITSPPATSSSVSPVWAPKDTCEQDGLKMRLEWSAGTPPKYRNRNEALLYIQNHEGKPVTDLETYMGAEAHLVAIHQDCFTILHMHPEKEREAGAPLRFAATPRMPGFHRLFVQVKRQGNVQTLPLGFTVE